MDEYVMVDIPKWKEYQSTKKKHNEWIKLDTNMMHDPVIRNLNSEAFRCWVGLLLRGGSVGVPFKFCPSSAGVLFGFRHSSVFYHLVDQGLITTQNYKNRREENRKEEKRRDMQNVKAPRISSKECPKDFIPSERAVAKIREHHPSLTKQDFQEGLKQMKAYVFPTAKTDWDATYRNWMNGFKSKTKQMSTEQRRIENIKEAARSFANE